MRAALGLLDRVETVVTRVAAACMFAIMLIVSADVLMRYVFNRPFGWAYDLISLYLMAAVFFLVLSNAYARGAHVSVDILQQRFPEGLFRLSEIVTCAASLVVFAIIARVGWTRAIDAYEQGDVLAGAIPWPTWPALALVPLGSGLLAIRLALHLVGHVASLATRRDLLPLKRHAHGEEGFE
jgi:TRAP-type C4-dicarboxylate transport system permease small subunit